jgi:Cyclic nucleotide-binding domain
MTDSETVVNLLRRVPLFANLKDEDKVCIEETEEWLLPAGEMLFQEGQHAEHFFVLLEGRIVVWKKHGDQEIVVARNRPGAFLLRFTRHSLHAVRSRRGRLPASRLSGGGVLEAGTDAARAA